MNTFYTFYYKPSIYGYAPYMENNRMYVFESKQEATNRLEILKKELSLKLKPYTEYDRKFMFIKLTKNVFPILSEEGKIIKTVLDTICVKRISLHYDRDL